MKKKIIFPILAALFMVACAPANPSSSSEEPPVNPSTSSVEPIVIDVPPVSVPDFPTLSTPSYKEEKTGFKVNFVTDEYSRVVVYVDADCTKVDLDTQYQTRSNGEYSNDPDKAQISFKILTAPGRIVKSVVPTKDMYKNMKDPVETEIEKAYRVTKIKGDITITIETCEQLEGFDASFVTDEHAHVTVYTTQACDVVDPDGPNYQTRDGDSGLYCNDGDNSQLNFVVTFDEGYELDSMTATKDAYKNIKGPGDTGVVGGYRITKVKADIVVTITSKAIVA